MLRDLKPSYLNEKQIRELKQILVGVINILENLGHTWSIDGPLNVLGN